MTRRKSKKSWLSNISKGSAAGPARSFDLSAPFPPTLSQRLLLSSFLLHPIQQEMKIKRNLQGSNVLLSQYLPVWAHLSPQSSDFKFMQYPLMTRISINNQQFIHRYMRIPTKTSMQAQPSFAKAYVRLILPATRTVPHWREARPIVSSGYLRDVRIGIVD